MFNWLKQRSKEPELMDDFSVGGTHLREALRHLQSLNRIFGAAGPTLYGVKRLWSEAGKPSQFTILDIGCGSGDVNRLVLRWARKNNIELNIIWADITEEACEEARLLYRHEQRIQVVRRDLFQLTECCADMITATQFVHHFSSEDLPEVVRSMLKASRFGIVINDIHRHWISWLAVWLVTRIISRNRYIRKDGPLSVAKGFRSADWKSIKNALVLPDLTYSWRPLFRYVVIVRRIDRKGFPDGGWS